MQSQTKPVFSIQPRRNCPHIKSNEINGLQDMLEKSPESLTKGKCQDCCDDKHLWVCLTCSSIYCSILSQGHMVQHNAATKHPVAMSLFNAYFFCYECQGYVINITVNLFKNKFLKLKFPEGEDEDDMKKLAREFSEHLKVEQKQEKQKIPPFNREELVEGLRNKKFKKIVFLTGAGISVSSGIPDFRTPGTGLYSQMAKYNLPQPESVFNIEYFKTNPEPFYMLTKQSFKPDIKPVISHKFIKKINDQNILLKVITQNIDGLELDAGLPLDKLIQAHGHNRSARCIQCRKQVKIEDWNKAIQQQKVMRCSCDKNGLIKPDVVFFGEQLPSDFKEALTLVKEADLVIVMGTSLVVFPFAFLLEKIDDKVPLVLINNTDSRRDKKRPNSLWLDGNLDERIKAIADDLKWDLA